MFVLSRQQLAIVGLALIMAMALAIAIFRRGENALPTEPSTSLDVKRGTADGETTVPPERIITAFVSQDVCAECHAEIVAEYKRSGMSDTWMSPANRIAGDLKKSTVVQDSVSGYRYRVLSAGDAIYQEESHQDYEQHVLRRQAKYLVGSGKHAQAMVSESRGFLNLMPVAWFTGEQSWGMNPGYELQNRRFSRPVLPGCVACHGGGATHEPPTRNRFHQPIADGIDCGRCHGDAERHVTYWQAGGVGEQLASMKLAHPGRMDSRQSNDLCLQCHLQGDVVLYRPGHDPLHFAPGDRLRDHRDDLLIATEESSQLGVASHGARMLQSRCYVASQGKLTCVHCHDAHRPTSDVTRDQLDRQCGSCHTPGSCDRPLAAGEVRSETGCVSCHMPQRSSREGIHLVFTDHAILKHAPSVQAGPRQPPVLKPNSEVTLVSCWPNETMDSATLGAAYILLHDTMGPQLPSVTRGRELLEESLRQNPADQETRYWLGSAWLALRRGSEAIECFSEVLRADPQRHIARFRLALAQELVGDFAAATANYELLLHDAPSWVEPYPRLAQLYLSRQQPEATLRVLTQQLTYQEDALAFAQFGFAHRLRGGDPDEAMKYVNAAMQLDPRLPTAFLHRAALHLLSGRNELARSDFQHVLQLEPDNEQARQAMKALSGAK